MSRQFRVYLLPPDAELLMETLRSQVELSIIQPYSPGLYPAYVESPMRYDSLPQFGRESVRVDCYLAPSKDPDIRMRFIQARSQWSVQDESEVIEFRGCEYAKNILLQGRFYFQNDLLSRGMIIPKRTEFLSWADKVFRTAKKSLQWSKTLDAYVGEEAEKWRQAGGRFAEMITPSGPIYAREKP